MPPNLPEPRQSDTSLAPVDRFTGELLDPRNLEQLGDYLERLRELRQAVQDEIGGITGLVVSLSSQYGKKTLRSGDVKVEVKSNVKREWDLDVLDQLLDAGLPLERWEEMVKSEVVTTVSWAIAKQLKASNPEYARIIDEAMTEIPTSTYVTVSR